MDRLSLTDYESLTEEQRRDLREDIQSKLDALNGIVKTGVLEEEVDRTSSTL